MLADTSHLMLADTSHFGGTKNQGPIGQEGLERRSCQGGKSLPLSKKGCSTDVVI